MGTAYTILDANPTADTGPGLHTIISQIEESLRVSQQALLLRDLTTFERQTTVQANLSQMLANSLRNAFSEKYDELATSSRVLHLGRVHLGLLRRAQRSLHVLSHLLARPESGYGSFAEVRPLSAGKVVSHSEG